jgi:PRTRC genetic system ThiF family protein
MALTVNKYLHEDLHDITVILVGAGGNGSFMLSNLARINYALRALGKKGLYVTVRDHDTVSDNNVGRQLFSPSDIGKFKAKVLVDRVNRTYGTTWEYNTTKVTPKSTLQANIIITAVDNVETRRNASQIFLNSNKNYNEVYRSLYWLDMGNGKDFGQIILTDGKKVPGLFDMFPDLKDTKQDGPSCSMQQALRKQDLFINSTVTQFAGKLLFDLLTKKKIDYHGAFINLKTLDLKPLKL